MYIDVWHDSPVPQSWQFILQTNIQFIKHSLSLSQVLFCLCTNTQSRLVVLTRYLPSFLTSTRFDGELTTNLCDFAVILHPWYLQSFQMVACAIVVNQFPAPFGHAGLKQCSVPDSFHMPFLFFNHSTGWCIPSGLETAADTHPGSRV